MTAYLLDSNVLIATCVAEHEHHARVAGWLAEAPDETVIGVCPITEGALLRFILRVGETTRTAVAVLDAVRRRPGVEFWPDSASYLDVDLQAVRGHRQVTDTYLVGLARQRQARLATLDQGLATRFPAGTVLV